GPERLRAMYVEISARWAGLEATHPKTLPDLAAVETALAELGLSTEAEPSLERRIEVFGANARAYFHHQPRAISARVTLLETEDEHPTHPRPPTLGWEEIATDIERHTTPGTHFSAVFGTHAHALAARIDQLLADVS